VSWIPTTETGLVAWFDLQDASTYTLTGGGATISDIRNKVSLAVWDTPSSDTPFESAGLNGHPCLHPTAVAHRIQSTEAAVLALMTNAQAFTIYYVVQFDASDATGTVFSACVTTGGFPRRTFGQSTSGLGRQLTSFTNDASATLNTTAAVDNTTTSMAVVSWATPGTTMSGYVGSSAADPSAAACNPGSLTPTRLGLLAVPDNAADTPLIGRFGELLLYAGEHNSTQRADAVAYLTGRWSLAVPITVTVAASIGNELTAAASGTVGDVVSATVASAIGDEFMAAAALVSASPVQATIATSIEADFAAAASVDATSPPVSATITADIGVDFFAEASLSVVTDISLDIGSDITADFVTQAFMQSGGLFVAPASVDADRIAIVSASRLSRVAIVTH
jgi:hypothetical protein